MGFKIIGYKILKQIMQGQELFYKNNQHRELKNHF